MEHPRCCSLFRWPGRLPPGSGSGLSRADQAVNGGLPLDGGLPLLCVLFPFQQAPNVVSGVLRVSNCWLCATGIALRTRWTGHLSKEIGASLGELNVVPELVLPQPALFDGIGEAAPFRRRNHHREILIFSI
jgi:hypothetical protein